MSSKMMVFTGNANPALARKVADRLYLGMGNAAVAKFSDGEITVELNENVRGKDVFVIQSTCHPTNDNIIELLLMIDALAGPPQVESRQSYLILDMPDKTAEYARHECPSPPRWLPIPWSVSGWIGY